MMPYLSSGRYEESVLSASEICINFQIKFSDIGNNLWRN